MASELYDIVVIGGGPGGYVAAIRAAQLKAKVALVEKDKLGGTCTNVGCIPAKTFLYAAELVHETKKAGEFGIKVQGFSIDYARLLMKKDEVITKLSSGIEILLKSNAVEILRGEGKLVDSSSIEVKGRNNRSSNSDNDNDDNDKKLVRARKVIIATGSRPSIPPIAGSRSRGVFTSDEAFSLPNLLRRIVIVGGGPEGAEFASTYSALGVETTMVEMLPRIIPNEDAEIANRLHQALSRDGVKVVTNSKVEAISETGHGLRVEVQGMGEVETDGVLLAVGRSPYTSGLGLEEIGVELEKGRIVVNQRMETTVPGVYAIGDVTGGALAHEAMEEGIVAVENALGLQSLMDHSVIPRCIYTVPEVAAVGLTEEEARSKGYKVRVGRFTFSASGRAYTMGEKDGLVKTILDEGSGKLVGVHILGSRASEMIAEAAVAMSGNGGGARALMRTIHPHPTLSETIKEAVLDSERFAIHRVRMPLSR